MLIILLVCKSNHRHYIYYTVNYGLIQCSAQPYTMFQYIVNKLNMVWIVMVRKEIIIIIFCFVCIDHRRCQWRTDISSYSGLPGSAWSPGQSPKWTVPHFPVWDLPLPAASPEPHLACYAEAPLGETHSDIWKVNLMWAFDVITVLSVCLCVTSSLFYLGWQ